MALGKSDAGFGLGNRRRAASRGSELTGPGGIQPETTGRGARDTRKVDSQTRYLESLLGFPKTVILGTDPESSPDPAFCPLDWSLASLSGDLPGPRAHLASMLTQLRASVPSQTQVGLASSQNSLGEGEVPMWCRQCM